MAIVRPARIKSIRIRELPWISISSTDHEEQGLTCRHRDLLVLHVLHDRPTDCLYRRFKSQHLLHRRAQESLIVESTDYLGSLREYEVDGIADQPARRLVTSDQQQHALRVKRFSAHCIRLSLQLEQHAHEFIIAGGFGRPNRLSHDLRQLEYRCGRCSCSDCRPPWIGEPGCEIIRQLYAA